MVKADILGTEIDLPDVDWTPAERAAWRWQQPLKPSEWAESHRYLTEGDSDIVGPWRNANAPYLRGIMDIASKPGVSEVAIPKAAQLGVSEAARNIIGWIAHEDPAPTALVLPDKERGQQIVTDRILPLFRGTPALNALMSPRKHDAKKGQLTLINAFTLYLMWSGSPSSLASNPIRWAIADEIDKFAQFSGREGDPLSLLRKRTRSFGDRARILKISTPTTPDGPIWQEHEAADYQLHFLLPCPSCDTRQRLVFEQLKFDAGDLENAAAKASHVMHDDASWYECRRCGHRWNTRDRNRLVQRGVWGTCDEQGIADGEIEDAETIDAFPPGSRLSMMIGAFYARWVGFSDIAAEFLRADGRVGPLFDFRTQTLGEAFEYQVDSVPSEALAQRAAAARLPEAVLPWWTVRVLASIDTQADHFWLVIRAFGPGWRSARVLHGRVETFEELEQWLWQTPYRFEDNRQAPRVVDLAVIDAGGTRAKGLPDETDAETSERPSRTMEVYRWVLQQGGRVRAIRGNPRPQPGEPIKRSKGVYVGQNERTPLPLWLLDTHHFQDELAELINREVPDVAVNFETGELHEDEREPAWQLNQRQDDEYNRHMSNLRKVARRVGSGMAHHWVPIGSGVRVDLRMCEGYMIACAYMSGVHYLPGIEQHVQQRIAEIQRAPADQANRPQFTNPSGQPYLATHR